METNFKIKRIVAVILFTSFIAASMASCSSSKYGCPDNISKAEQETEERV